MMRHGSANSDGSFNPNPVDLSDYLAQVTPNATAGQPLFGPGSVLLFSNRPAQPNKPQKYTQLATAQAVNDPDNFACTVDGVEVCVKVKDGQPKFTGLSNNYNKPQSMNALHLLQGRELNGNLNSKSTLLPKIKLPMDSQFLFTKAPGVQDSRNYLVPRGTQTVGP